MIIRALVCACAVASLATPSAAQEWPQIELEERWNGFDSPVFLTHADDGSGRVFVVEQPGRVIVIEDGEVRPDAFLDITDRVSCCGERGLLSVAFPPGYSAKQYLYVNYTDLSGDTVVSRIHLSGNPNRVDPDTEEVVLTIDQPYSNHNGGQLAFGPDGYLYIGAGDGGAAGDPDNNGQDPLTLLGAMLRIDVESGEVPYAIPDTNPFAFDDAHQPEIWAYGLRNPWRFSFDPGTGDLFIADVGQNAWEEVNLQRASSPGGENYGWRIMEGSQCYNPNPCDTAGLVLPVTEYDHSRGCSVTGGYVYRGSRWPRLDGVYVFGDYCSGRIWGLRQTGGGWERETLIGSTGFNISSFGVDEIGTVYVVGLSNGTVYAMTDPEAEEDATLLVPAVAHLLGSGGTPWRSELVVSNPAGVGTTAAVRFEGGGMVFDAEVEIEALGGVSWSDVLVDLFGMDPGDQVAGVLEISSPTPLVAGVRSYAAPGGGTYGQYLPGLRRGSGIGPGEVGIVGQLARSDDRYTNFGIINLSDLQVTAIVTLRDALGQPLAEPIQLELAPARWQQLNDVLAGMGEHAAASARIEVGSPGGRVWAYASIIDRSSRDPTTVPMTVQ